MSTTNCFRPRSGLFMNFRVRMVNSGMMLAVDDDQWSDQVYSARMGAVFTLVLMRGSLC